MAAQTTAEPQRDRPAASMQPGIARAMRVVLWLLAVAVFAQSVFAGLFLDGHGAWRDWLLLALLAQSVLGQAGQVAVHVLLGVAIFGLIGSMLVRARILTRTATHPSAMAGRGPGVEGRAGVGTEM